MATTVDTLLVRIEADLKDVNRKLAQFDKKVETTSSNAGRRLKTIGTVAQAAIGGVLVASFARGIMSLTNFASDMEEMSSMSEAVFGGFVDSVRHQLEDFGTEVGRSRFELEAMAASVQDTFVPLGFARGTAADLSVQLTKLAVDVASFKNELEPNVMNAFQSALVGNHEAVRRFGIVITEAELKNELFRMGITKNVKEVDAQTKVQARLNLIIAGTKDAQGDAAKTAGSFANQSRALDAELKLLAADLGNELLPVMKGLLEITISVTKEFRGFLRAIGVVSGAHDDLVENLARVKKAQEAVAEAQAKLADNPDYAPFIRKAERANKELNAALAEQDELLDPIIEKIRSVGNASEEAAQSTDKLTAEMSDGEKVVGALDLQLRQLKADQQDTTGITSELLGIQSDLGDEYMQYAALITDLLENIHALNAAQEAQADTAGQLADEVTEGLDALREFRKEQEEAATSRAVNALLKQIESLKEYKGGT